MPELPEVETVRLGLARDAIGARIADLTVTHPRAVRRQPGGGQEFAGLIRGREIAGVHRRGKYLWFDFTEDPEAVLVAHLGMSGQFRLVSEATNDPHVRVHFQLADGRVLQFRDQRTFGWVLADEFSDTPGDRLPRVVAHIAPDPFSASYDPTNVLAKFSRSQSGIKRLILDQTVVSGIGNIYADEALWAARIHYETPAWALSAQQGSELLEQAQAVMARSLSAGGTSFDSLYVNIGGDQGWYATQLNAYGQEGKPCPRCGAPIRRERFANRSSAFCPACQTAPNP